MSYSTLLHLKERINEATILQLTDDDNLGVIDDTKVAAAIARADAEIDTWCAQRYLVPLAIVPPIISGLSADLAIYYLYSRIVETIPEARAAAHKNALSLLKAISAGQVTLSAATPPEPAASGSGASFVGADRVMSRTSLRDM